MSSLVLVLGGVRSGKSRFAQDLAQHAGGDDVLFVATAEAGDEEMSQRIDHHRRTRPPQWRTLEQPQGVGRAIRDLRSPPPVILLDCLTLLVTNVLMQNEADRESAEREVLAEADALVTAVQEQNGTMIVVSGEVGLGVVPPSPLGRRFRDLLGWANQRIAAQADATYLMVAGRAVEVGRLSTSAADAARSLRTTSLKQG